ncbi:MAG TPA: hypothetical protein VL442_01085 [Mucilaginibacter sp.]|jgi:hypothetical protein|nr:hypothetical protein [Mucilaginibacter sp.]
MSVAYISLRKFKWFVPKPFLPGIVALLKSMAKEQQMKVNNTQPEKDKNPGEDTFEKDNNTNEAATPKSTLTTNEAAPEEQKDKRNKH